METDPGGVMERQLVEKYLHAQGHCLRSVRELPEALRRPLLAAAARYASLQMTEGDTEHRVSTSFTNAGLRISSSGVVRAPVFTTWNAARGLLIPRLTR